MVIIMIINIFIIDNMIVIIVSITSCLGSRPQLTPVLCNLGCHSKLATRKKKLELLQVMNLFFFFLDDFVFLLNCRIFPVANLSGPHLRRWHLVQPSTGQSEQLWLWPKRIGSEIGSIVV